MGLDLGWKSSLVMWASHVVISPLKRTGNKLLDVTMTFGLLLLTRAMIVPMLLRFPLNHLHGSFLPRN